MDAQLKQYVKMIAFLGETLGNTFEASLYDLTDPAYPMVATTSYHSDTQEKVRAFIAEVAGSQKVRDKGYFVNRPIQVDFGKLIKTSVFLIPGDENVIVGALCLNVRCDLFLKMGSFATDMIRFNTEDIDGNNLETDGFDANAQEPSLDAIAETVHRLGLEPGRISQEERLEIICDLYDMGVFTLKGAVAKTADTLQVSEQSVYRYLTKIKKMRDW